MEDWFALKDTCPYALYDDQSRLYAAVLRMQLRCARLHNPGESCVSPGTLGGLYVRCDVSRTRSSSSQLPGFDDERASTIFNIRVPFGAASTCALGLCLTFVLCPALARFRLARSFRVVSKDGEG